MRTQIIRFPNQQALCAFPENPPDLVGAMSELRLDKSRPVIVLIGGHIDDEQAVVTRLAIQSIARAAEDMDALVICGGTDMGVMAEIGKVRWQNHWAFPLLGITLEDLVTWPDGPPSTKFLWWGIKRWQLAPYYSHFMLVPGHQFGDESPWIANAATTISNGQKSVTILLNGGDVSRKDVDLSLQNARGVIVLSGTGRLADELTAQSDRHELIFIVPANDDQKISAVVRGALSQNDRIILPH